MFTEDGADLYVETAFATLKSGEITAVGSVSHPGAEEGEVVSYQINESLILVASGFYRILSDGSISQFSGPTIISSPSPMVNVSNCQLQNVRYGADGLLYGDLTVSGTVTSEFCDTIPGALGTINNALLYVNGSENAIALIQLNVSKSTGSTAVVGKPYPYLGTFSHTEANIALTEGNNIFHLTAMDLVNRDPGYSTWVSFVGVTEPGTTVPPALWGSENFSMGVTIPAATTGVPAPREMTFTATAGTAAPVTATLTETGAQTSTFAGTANGGTILVTLVDEQPLNDDRIDRVLLEVTTSGGTFRIHLGESSAMSRFFTGGYTSFPPGGTSSSDGTGGADAPPPPPPAHGSISAEFPTNLMQSRGGYFVKHARQFGALPGYNFERLTFGGTPFQLFPHGFGGRSTVGDANGRITPFSAVRTASPDSPDDESIYLQCQHLSFNDGYLRGLSAGGVDMAVSIAGIGKSTVRWVGGSVLLIGAQANVIFRKIGGNPIEIEDAEAARLLVYQASGLQEEHDKLSDTLDALEPIADMIQANAAAAGEVATWLLTRDENALEGLSVLRASEMNAVAFEVGAELITKALKDLQGATPGVNAVTWQEG